MLRLVVGTAGHIDHGKTSLLRALTGIDADRLAEEKARGITIDLGFAHCQEGDTQIGFVDVPGHEKFLHNALVGLGGIRLVLLVVAADEGPMPQTREHLAICQLLGLRHAVVALTKIDRVDEETQELVKLEIAESLEPTPFAQAPIFPVSSTLGTGIETLRTFLLAQARELSFKAEPSKPARLPIDRAFQLRGLGAVVTGSLLSGRIEAGRSLEWLPAGRIVKTRGLQVHGRDRDQADAGERLALQLAGVEVNELERGQTLGEPGIFAAQRTLCVRLTWLQDAPTPLDRTLDVVFFHHTTETMARLRPLSGPLAPGATGLAELRLAGRAMAIRGDHFVIRRPSPPRTLGGGQILDPAWRRRRGPTLAPALAKIAGDDEAALDLWLAERGERGLGAEELCSRLGRRAEPIQAQLEARVRAGKALAVDLNRAGTNRARRYLDPRACQKVLDRARVLLKTYFAADRLARGMPRAEFLSRLLSRRAHELAPAYLALLQAQRIVVLDGELINLPGRSARANLSLDESSLAQRVLDLMERGGLQPPSPGEITAVLGAKAQIVEGIQKFLIEQKKLRKLPAGLIFSTAALEGLRRDLLALDWDRFSVPQFKDHFGLSRKWAIPLLEHLDSVGATRRLGDDRQIVRRS